MPGLHTFSQDSSSFWENYLRKNVDTTVPIRNKAKKGTYNVIVSFIIIKDGYVADVKAETNHGYGMEEEVIRAVKKYSRWGWGQELENSKVVKQYHRLSFIFIVPKKKVFAKKRRSK